MVLHAPTKEASGLSRFINPAGFHEAAVASSATAMNADCPNARAPEPTGSGVIEIFVVWEHTTCVKLTHTMNISVSVLPLGSSIICLLGRSPLIMHQPHFLDTHSCNSASVLSGKLNNQGIETGASVINLWRLVHCTRVNNPSWILSVHFPQDDQIIITPPYLKRKPNFGNSYTSFGCRRRHQSLRIRQRK